MPHINIDVDDVKVNEVMRRFNIVTKREAVDFALRHLIEADSTDARMTGAELLALDGIGWEGDLDQMRGGNRTWLWNV